MAECMEDSSSVPTVKYDFVPINDIGNKATDSLLGKAFSYSTNIYKSLYARICLFICQRPTNGA